MADRIEDGGPAEAGRDLVADLIKRSETDPLHRLMTSLGDALAFRAAAAEITRLRAENAGMLEALKPFAFERSALDLSRYDDENQVEVRYPPVGRHQRIPVGRVTIGSLRRARAALSNATTPETGGRHG